MVFWVLIGAISINLLYLAYLIFPFTIFGKKQVIKAKNSIPDQSISIMISNVYQYNNNTNGCLQEVKKANPDIVFLLETDKKWEEGTKELKEKYPYHILVPKENTYGMLFYSKLELKDYKVDYIVEDNVPSIHTKVVLKSGKEIIIHGVHPTPPAPGENIKSTERDKELLIVADIAKEEKLPVIVIGDLNDVAWSHTTKLFLKMSGLLDPRRGRGFFNSFHARYPFLRFPLDHAFISPDFKLNAIKRLSNFGSDHFPIYISVQYEAKADSEQEEMHADPDDIQEAEEKKSKE